MTGNVTRLNGLRPHFFNLNPMGMTKHYLTTIICACAPDNGFAQDAIEHAIVTGGVALTMDPAHDVLTIMRQYDFIIENYRRARSHVAPLLEATMAFAVQSGLPVPAMNPEADKS